MKKIFSLCTLFAAANVLCISNTAFAAFTDTQYSWYRDAIATLEKDDIIAGTSPGIFSPDLLVTRAEILAMLIKTAKVKLPDAPKESCFPDVAVDTWYHPYICGAYTLGMANGFESGKFGPNDTVTALEALAFGLKAFSLEVEKDADKPWYIPSQAFADTNNIMKTHGYTLATKISRAKTAELIVRLREYTDKKSALDYKSNGCAVNGNLGAKNTITINEKAREYNLAVPSNYSRDKQYGLIIGVHGRTNSKDQVQAYMGLQGRSQDDFIVAYPAALKSGSSFSWSEKDNLTFFDSILLEVSDNYCVNRDDIFIVGHSLGGWFTQKLACLRGDLVKGMVAVGSGGYKSDCTGPVTTLLYQNVNDHLSSYASGKSAEQIRLTVNQCGPETEDVKVGPLTCKKYTDCSPGNSVTWCEGYTGYRNDPHSWPTSG
jgi:polyhydroxybutyrate depolymerase